MGTRMALSYANLFFFFLAKFKRALVNAVFRPYIWWRYIDDIFMVWTKGEENLKTLLNYLNSLHPTIKFTQEYSISSLQSLPFQTDLYTKPTDKHQYLLKASCHSIHTKRLFPFTFAIRLRRTCSTDFLFEKTLCGTD